MFKRSCKHLKKERAGRFHAHALKRVVVPLSLRPIWRHASADELTAKQRHNNEDLAVSPRLPPAAQLSCLADCLLQTYTSSHDCTILLWCKCWIYFYVLKLKAVYSEALLSFVFLLYTLSWLRSRIAALIYCLQPQQFLIVINHSLFWHSAGTEPIMDFWIWTVIPYIPNVVCDFYLKLIDPLIPLLFLLLFLTFNPLLIALCKHPERCTPSIRPFPPQWSCW